MCLSEKKLPVQFFPKVILVIFHTLSAISWPVSRAHSPHRFMCLSEKKASSAVFPEVILVIFHTLSAISCPRLLSIQQSIIIAEAYYISKRKNMV